MKQLYTVLLWACLLGADNQVGEPLKIAENISDTFGKTHFIVGEPVKEYPSKGIQNTVPSSSKNINIFFAPDDNLQEALVRLINDEQEKVRAAIFLFTDSEIAQALVAAKKRGVQVELITDTSCIRERHNKVGKLCDCGCLLFVYNPSYNSKDSSSIMHHKFMLFEKNKQNKSLVWTGSFNFTKAASKINQENAIVVDDREVFQKFVTQFDQLKERAYRYGINTKNRIVS